MVNNDLGLAEISKQILLWNHMYRSEYTVKLWEYSLDDHPPSIIFYMVVHLPNLQSAP
jgi:hypothetical protein